MSPLQSKSCLLLLALNLSLTTVTGFGVVSPLGGSQNVAKSTTALDAGLYFGTIGGATKRCAELIAAEAGIEKCIEIEDLKDTADLTKHDSLIIGSPTWK